MLCARLRFLRLKSKLAASLVQLTLHHREVQSHCVHLILMVAIQFLRCAQVCTHRAELFQHPSCLALQRSEIDHLALQRSLHFGQSPFQLTVCAVRVIEVSHQQHNLLLNAVIVAITEHVKRLLKQTDLLCLLLDNRVQPLVLRHTLACLAAYSVRFFRGISKAVLALCTVLHHRLIRCLEGCFELPRFVAHSFQLLLHRLVRQFLLARTLLCGTDLLCMTRRIFCASHGRFLLRDAQPALCLRELTAQIAAASFQRHNDLLVGLFCELLGDHLSLLLLQLLADRVQLLQLEISLLILLPTFLKLSLRSLQQVIQLSILVHQRFDLAQRLLHRLIARVAGQLPLKLLDAISLAMQLPLHVVLL